MADICLLVEGAYPYVSGGVSSWVQDLLTNLPDLTFAVMHIGSHPDPHRKALYTFPKNVVEFREVFINDMPQVKKYKRSRHSSAAWQALYSLYESILTGTPYNASLVLPMLRQSGFGGLTSPDILYAPESWDLMVKLYTQYAAGQPFADFFWTFRFLSFPFLKILESELPQAQVYHAVSTGFCGLLGALTMIRSGTPFLVTEHGIYTREREMEIIQSTWLNATTSGYRLEKGRMSFFQQWWFNLFRFMEHITYYAAKAVISITKVNQQYQMQHGAEPLKMRLIPNGVSIQQLGNLRQMKKPAGDRFLVGFVGRIVPIKDVKTLIHALKIASQAIPHLEAYLVGPTEEDSSYFQECQRLVSLLGLELVVHFIGRADVKTYYSQLDVLVLTSLSEGQPLVILEANCAGIPVIATDVGACRELLTGISPEDQALGASGIVTPVASPQETAKAIVELWQDKDKRLRMGEVGQIRIQRYYRQEQLYSAYRELYISQYPQTDQRRHRGPISSLRAAVCTSKPKRSMKLAAGPDVSRLPNSIHPASVPYKGGYHQSVPKKPFSGR